MPLGFVLSRVEVFAGEAGFRFAHYVSASSAPLVPLLAAQSCSVHVSSDPFEVFQIFM